MRDQTEGRLETEDPAIRGRDPHGATLVTADADVDLAGGDGSSRAGRRAARRYLRIARIGGLRVVEGQTVEDVLADDGAAGVQNPGHHSGVEVGDEAV